MWGLGGEGRRSVRAKNVKISMKLKLEFPEGWGILGKVPSMGQIWIFSVHLKDFYMVSDWTAIMVGTVATFLSTK